MDAEFHVGLDKKINKKNRKASFTSIRAPKVKVSRGRANSVYMAFFRSVQLPLKIPVHIPDCKDPLDFKYLAFKF